MFELKQLTCKNCGGAIERQTMKCPYCDTQYERRNNGVTINYVVEQPGVHRLKADIRVDDEMMLHDPEGATRYVMDRLRHEIADGLLDYMKIYTSKDYNPMNRCQIIRGEVRALTRHLYTTKEENKMKGKYVVVRGDRSGVFAGTLESQEGRNVVLTGVRRLWRWYGATECLQIAMEGVKRPRDCRFTMTADSITLLDAIEIIPTTEAAEANIKAVPEWKM